MLDLSDIKKKVFKGDCLEWMSKFPDQSFDMILCDLPYGTSQCKWDVIIPFEFLWKEYKRIIKSNGAIVLTGTEPFSSLLRMSNLEMYKYDWVWDTVNKITNHLNAKKQPMRRHENISVFYKKQCLYNPQFRQGGYKSRKSKNGQSEVFGKVESIDYGNIKDKLYPVSILPFEGQITNSRLHPTQKSVELFEYLIKTYTNEDDLILDNCCGSGTTGIAALNTKRNFTLIEKEKEYYDITIDRIVKHKENLKNILERKDNE